MVINVKLGIILIRRYNVILNNFSLVNYKQNCSSLKR